MDNEKLQNITLSGVKYVNFKRRNFVLIKGEYDFQDCFEEISNDYTLYKPFDIPDLYEQFSKIDPNNKMEMLNFINEYGNIGTYEDNKRPLSEKYSERCSYWRDKILEMKRSLLLLEIFKSENIAYAVKTKKKQLSLFKDSFLCELWFKYGWNILYENNLKSNESKNLLHIEEQLKFACLSDLQLSIKNNIEEISFMPMIDVDSDDKPCIKANIEFSSLLSIMYWQLYMGFFENNRYFICEGCNQTFPWFNNKKNYLCNDCYGRHNYNRQINKTKTKAHRKFMNRSGHYASENVSSCLFIDKEHREILYRLRENIKDKSLENQKKMSEEDYIIWLKGEDEAFMEKAKEYKKEV